MPPLLEQSGDFLSSLEEGGHEEFHSLNEVFQPLNIFKLNEFRARVDQVMMASWRIGWKLECCVFQEKVTKLSKLGVSKTSQISLEGDGTGFSTGVLELNDELKQTLCPSAEELPDPSRADKSETQSQTNGGKFVFILFIYKTGTKDLVKLLILGSKLIWIDSVYCRH